MGDVSQLVGRCLEFHKSFESPTLLLLQCTAVRNLPACSSSQIWIEINVGKLGLVFWFAKRSQRKSIFPEEQSDQEWNFVSSNSPSSYNDAVLSYIDLETFLDFENFCHSNINNLNLSENWVQIDADWSIVDATLIVVDWGWCWLVLML